MLGVVQSYRTDKGFGWIKGDDGCRYFAHQRDIAMDHLYLRYLDTNELVEFEPSVDSKNRKYASNIVAQNRPEQDMPHGYWEIGTISYVGQEGTGWIERWMPHEAIFFTNRDVATFGPVEVGTKVVFGFQHDNVGRLKAANIEICLPDFDISEYMIYQN